MPVTSDAAASDPGPATKSRRPFSTVLAGLAHFWGQVLGFGLAILVSHLIARKLGFGVETDAFYFGRRITTSLIETLNQIMVVLYIPLFAADALGRPSDTWRLFIRRVCVAGLFGCLLAVGMTLASGWIVDKLAPDYPDDGKALAAQILTLFSIALPATMVSVVAGAYLNVRGQFGAPSAISQLPRAAIVVTLLFATTAIAVQGALAFSIGCYVVAAILLVVSLIATRADRGAGAERDGDPALTPRSVRYGGAAVLLVIGALAGTWLETSFAAGIGSGGLTTLELSQRLGALLANTLAVALSLAVFASWSRDAAAGSLATGGNRLGRTIVIGICVIAPVQVYFFLNASSVVEILLDHGAFSAEAGDAVAQSIRWMVWAPLSAFVLRMIVVRILVEPSISAVRFVALSVAADVTAKYLLYRYLTPEFGVVGIVLGQAIAPALPIVLLLAATARWKLMREPIVLGRSWGLVAAAALGVLGMFLGRELGTALAPLSVPLLGAVDKDQALVELLSSGAIGLVLFLIAFRAFRVPLRLE